MTDFKSELRKMELSGKILVSTSKIGYLFELDDKSVDDIIALFISKGWVSPENAAKAQKMVNDMANLAVNTMQLPTKVYIKPNRAMTKAQNLMTGQEWYSKFNAEIDNIQPLEMPQGLKEYGKDYDKQLWIAQELDKLVMEAAQRASGIKGEIK